MVQKNKQTGQTRFTFLTAGPFEWTCGFASIFILSLLIEDPNINRTSPALFMLIIVGIPLFLSAIRIGFKSGYSLKQALKDEDRFYINYANRYPSPFNKVLQLTLHRYSRLSILLLFGIVLALTLLD